MKKRLLCSAVISAVAVVGSALSLFAGTAQLSWDANSESDLAGYKIYYGLSVRTSTCPTGGYASVIDAGNTTYYLLSSLQNEVTFYFSVTAYDTSNNESCLSNEVSKYMSPSGDEVAPSVPSNLLAAPASATQIDLSWGTSTDNVGVAGYRIYRAGTLLTSVTSLTYSDTGLSPSTEYSYTVSAYDDAGNESQRSTAASATTSAAASSGAVQKEYAYPVPFTGDKNARVTFANLKADETSKIEIYSLDGNLIYEKEVAAPYYSFVPSDFASGTYVYHIKTSKGVTTGKIVIIK